MRNAFNMKIEELSRNLGTAIDLSLKFIVHYGAFSQYRIGNFRKLYGKTVVEAHQLLKNGLAIQPSYALYSNSFLENSSQQDTDFNKDDLRQEEVGVIHYFENVN